LAKIIGVNNKFIEKKIIYFNYFYDKIEMINFKNSNFVTYKPFYSFYEEFFIKWGIFFKKILMIKSQNIKFNIKKIYLI